VANAYRDIITYDSNGPYERIDGVKPINNRYDASVGPLLGMGMPGTIFSVKVTIATASGH
jgi:hypothetical protein